MNIETIKDQLLGCVALSQYPNEAKAWTECYYTFISALNIEKINALRPGIPPLKDGFQVHQKKDEPPPPMPAESPFPADLGKINPEGSGQPPLEEPQNESSPNIHRRMRNLGYAPGCEVLFEAAEAVRKAEAEALCANCRKRNY